MICLQCLLGYSHKPARTYWCSQACWAEAVKTTAWRILPEGPGSVDPVNLTTLTYYPRLRHNQPSTARTSQLVRHRSELTHHARPA